MSQAPTKSSASKYQQPAASTYRSTASGTLAPPLSSQIRSTQSRAPQGSVYPATKPGTVVRTPDSDATKLHRNAATTVPSRSVMRSSANTQLQRDNKTVVPGTRLNRDDDDAPKSIFKSQKDNYMAKRQSVYRSLTPQKQKENDEWIIKFFEDHPPCPEGYSWTRREGGYICSKGGHGVTDEMIGEKLGAICAMPKGRNFEWDEREGPYYPSEKAPGDYRYEEKYFPGVRVPAKYQR